MADAAAAGRSLSVSQAHHRARLLLRAFCEDKHWLAALAEEGEVFDAPDPEDEQLLRALDRFKGGEIALITRDEALLARNDARVLSPQQYCYRPEAGRSIDFIDLKSQQDRIRPKLEAGIHRVLHHGQYIMGPEIKALESKLSEYVGVAHCITCASGTDALLMALMALGIGPGDEVITVPYTWISEG
jgi:UDP-2-acetamido-2-deoxy-ribo-hexuluronate aminotransferase